MKNSKAHLLDAIDIFCGNGYEVTTYVTQSPNDAERYLLKNRKKYDVVCVFGGDGTMNEVSNALMRKEYKPLLGYFPSGTMAPSAMDSPRSGITLPRSIWLIYPNPLQCGHAPSGELKENLLGAGSA